jgi:hypothetical protein
MTDDADGVTLKAVEVLSETLDGLVCLIGRRRVQIPLGDVRGGTVRRPGDRGTLVVTQAAARRLGLAGGR